jgi:hypothetical protein
MKEAQLERRSRRQVTWLRRQRGAARTVLVASGLAACVALVGAPIAQAAAYTYANNISTAENQSRSTGPRTIKGGTASLQSFAVDGAGTVLYVESYYPAPGYRTLGLGSGRDSVNLIHQQATGAYQKCRWDWPWDGGNIGSLKMTCATK